MPRPKRTKIISEHARAEAAKAQTAARKPIAASHIRTGDKQKDKNSKTRNSSSRRSSKHLPGIEGFKKQNGVEIAMSGALGVGDVPKSSSISDEENRPVSRKRSALAEISPQRSTKQNAEDSGSKRRRSTRIAPWNDENHASAPLDDGFEDYLRSSSPHLPTTFISRPPSATKGQATPSILSIANFKRRPRQPSILRMVQQRMADDTDIGSEFGQENVNIDGLDSSPADVPGTRSSTSAKRKASALESDNTNDGLSTRKSFHNNGDIEIESSRRSTVAPTALTETADEGLNGLSIDGSSPSLPDLSVRKEPSTSRVHETPNRHQRRRRVRPKHALFQRAKSPAQPISEPSPQSTPDGSQEPVTKHATAGKQKQKQTKQPARQPKRAATGQRETITTASLQTLLPKRRVRPLDSHNRHHFDSLGSSDPIDDDSTLDNSATEPLRERSKTANAEHTSTDPDADEWTRKHLLKRTTAAQRSGKRQVTGAPDKGDGKAASRTYSRQEKNKRDRTSSDSVVVDLRGPLSDGEEQRDHSGRDANADAGGGVLKTQELAKAAEKFKEVDDWELSFESADAGARSSSPWR